MNVQAFMLIVPVVALAVGAAVYVMAALDERRQKQAVPVQTKKGVVVELSGEIVALAARISDIARRPSL